MQAAVETIDGFIVSMMDENVGPNGRRFVPLIFSIFIFVLALNILGLIPWVGAFTPTSHVAVTLALAFIIFGIVLIVGFWKHGLHFFTLFWPKGVNVARGIVFLPIVGVSSFARPLSLARRRVDHKTA